MPTAPIVARISTGSRIARTRWGRIEYADAGCGPAALVVHGAGGGFENVLPISMRHRGLWNDSKVATTLEPFEVDRIAAPTLIVSVRDDGFGTYAAARYLAERVPGARFVGHETGGHVWVGHHDALLREIDRFLARRLSATRSLEDAPAQAADFTKGLDRPA